MAWEKNFVPFFVKNRDNIHIILEKENFSLAFK